MEGGRREGGWKQWCYGGRGRQRRKGGRVEGGRVNEGNE